MSPELQNDSTAALAEEEEIAKATDSHRRGRHVPIFTQSRKSKPA